MAELLTFKFAIMTNAIVKIALGGLLIGAGVALKNEGLAMLGRKVLGAWFSRPNRNPKPSGPGDGRVINLLKFNTMFLIILEAVIMFLVKILFKKFI